MDNFWSPAPSITAQTNSKHLILFDIDGTLVHASQLHVNAFEYTMKAVFGISTIMDWPNSQGRTDPWIIQELARKAGVSDANISRNMILALDTLAKYYESHQKEETGKILPGGTELLHEIDERKVLRGLVTGNVEAIAFMKLRHFDLHTGFACGGFGDNHIERSVLIRLAIKIATEKYHFETNGKNIIYVADTPFDIQAAHDAGVRAIAVKTSASQNLNFESVKPELILKDLSEKKEFFEFLGLN